MYSVHPCDAGLYCENSPDIVEEAGRILGMPMDTVFNLLLPDGNPDELAPPFPGQHCLSSSLMFAASDLHSSPPAALPSL